MHCQHCAGLRKLHQNLASLKFPWLGSQLFAPSANSSSSFFMAMRIVTAVRVAQNRPWFCNHSWWSTIDEWLQMRPPSPSNLHHYKNEKPLSRHAILFYNLNHMTLENWIVIQMSWFSIMYLKNIQICHKIPSLNPPPIFYSSFFFFGISYFLIVS